MNLSSNHYSSLYLPLFTTYRKSFLNERLIFTFAFQFQSMRKYLLLFFIGCSFYANAQNTLLFNSLNDLLNYADKNSYTFKNANEQTLLAKYTRLAAEWGITNFTGNANLNFTDNTKLQTSFLPDRIFGIPDDGFHPVQLGYKYVTNFNITPQFDLINPMLWSRIKLAKANENLIAVNNLLNKKSLYESVSACYYNIVSYQSQIEITQKSLANTDTLVQIFTNKQKEGIIRIQDLNSVVANQLVLKDKLQQLQAQLQTQFISLKLLCDIAFNTNIEIINAENNFDNFNSTLEAKGNLVQQQSFWQHQYQLKTLHMDELWFSPTVSLIGNAGWVQSTNVNFLDRRTFYSTNYVGLKIMTPIVPDVNKIAAVKYDRVNLAIARNNWNHAALQDSLNNNQLKVDYQKSFNSYQLNKQIENLKEEIYFKNLNIYKEGVLSSTDLLNSFNDWLNSSLSRAMQAANSEFAKSKIIINNTIK